MSDLDEARRAIKDMAEAFADTAKASWRRNEALVVIHAGRFAEAAKRADDAVSAAITEQDTNHGS